MLRQKTDINRQPKTKRKPGQRLDPDVMAAIRDLLNVAPNSTGQQVLVSLKNRGYTPEQIPSTKTVEREKKKATLDKTGIWTLDGEDGDEARLVLEVLAEVLIKTDGIQQEMTKEDAKWIVRIRKAAPALLPWTVWKIRGMYKQRFALKRETVDLDFYLAFSQRPDGLPLYEKLVGEGVIPFPKDLAKIHVAHVQSYSPLTYQASVNVRITDEKGEEK